MARKQLTSLQPDSSVRRTALAERNNWKEYRQIAISLLRERDGDACGICGEEMAYDDITIDHVVEVIEGGRHEADNVRLAHGSCNGARKFPRCRKGLHDLTSSESRAPDGRCRECNRVTKRKASLKHYRKNAYKINADRRKVKHGT